LLSSNLAGLFELIAMASPSPKIAKPTKIKITLA